MAMTLEPCPFCGTADMDTCNPDGVFPDGGPHGYFVARCGNPDCAAEVSKQGREETIAAWNRRAHLTQPAQAVDVGAAEVVLDALDKAAESEWGRHIAWHGFRDEEARIAVVRTALAALAPAKVYVCTGCDREANDPGADLAAIQSAGGMTCCPERNIVERPTRALAGEKAEGWRDISTAPKDGTRIMLSNGHGVWMAEFHAAYPSGYRPMSPWFSVMLNHGHIPQAKRHHAPTHWQPLPTPPTDGEE